VKLTALLFAMALTGCASIGHKATLIPSEDSPWKEVNAFGQKYYEFECPQAYITFNPILIHHRISATGPIIPIIPIKWEQDRGNDDVILQINIAGDILSSQSALGSLNPAISANGKLIKAKSIEYDFHDFSLLKEGYGYSRGGLHVKASMNIELTLPIKAKEVSALSLSFSEKVGECQIPNFDYELDDGFWWEFVLTPGP